MVSCDKFYAIEN